MAIRTKMSQADRAKQFMPFAALKGFENALQEKEYIIVEQAELSEDRLEYLDYMLQQLKQMDVVTVVYYSEKNYRKLTGVVSKIDFDQKYVKLVNETIYFQDIYDLQIE